MHPYVRQRVSPVHFLRLVAATLFAGLLLVPTMTGVAHAADAIPLPVDILAGPKPKTALMPPLPLASPLAGPPLRPVASDERDWSEDVDRWTTAFTPKPSEIPTATEAPEVAEGEKWILADLSEQMVIAYEGETPVRGFIISSGLPQWPTVTGQFHIRTKVRSQVMEGGVPGADYYYLPNVQWVQYFYADYSFHGTYWHNDFGTPKSHGCINMTNTDAKWLFDWAGPEWDGKTTWYASTAENPGTLVIVQE